MGVLTGLLLLPVTGPVRAFRFLIERLHEEAEAVLRDEGRAIAELIDLSMRHNAGQLPDEEYAAQEAALLERLNSIRDYRKELLRGEPADDEDGYAEAADDETAYDDEPAADAPAVAADDHEESW